MSNTTNLVKKPNRNPLEMESTSGLVMQTIFNAKFIEIESKILCTSGLVTNAALNTIVTE